MRPAVPKETAFARDAASPVQASWNSSEILTVAAGGVAMLLVVVVLDVLGLL